MRIIFFVSANTNLKTYALFSVSLKRLADDPFGRILNLRAAGNETTMPLVKTVSHRTVKRQEAQQRLAGIKRARTSSRAAKKVQLRVSLVGAGAKWRITNLRQVARAMAAWA